MRLLFACLLFVCTFQNIVAGNFPSYNVDQLRSAMRDEIERSMKQLAIKNLQQPYFVEYTLSIRQSNHVKSTLGSVLDNSSGIVPRLTVGVRVGKAEFDNTNFFDVGLSFFGSSDDEESFKNRRMPAELDYTALRRELWLSTDACFKQAVELYAKKESAIKNRSRTDTTADFVLLKPTVTVDTFAIPEFDAKKIELMVTKLSAVFAEYASIANSTVSVEYLPELVIYVNSEGREYVKTELQTGIEVVASSQASDGMPIAQMYSAYSANPLDLPSEDSLMKATRRTAAMLDKVLSAKTVEAYSGPVLVEGQAAAELFAQAFAPNLCVQRAPLTERGLQENDRNAAFQNKVGARVLPEFLSVVSNPLMKVHGKTPCYGAYSIDDEGVKPEKLTVIDKGYLKTLFSSRVPTKRIKQSNGRQRGGAPMFDVVELIADKAKQLDAKQLKQKLIKMLKDRDLEYGFVIRKALNQNILFTAVFQQTAGDFPYSYGSSDVSLLEVFKVYRDGREELVRGTQAGGLAPSVFKDIVAVGKTQYCHNLLASAVTSPYMTGGAQYLATTVIVPDILFEDLEIKPLDGDFPKPPIMPSPLSTK